MAQIHPVAPQIFERFQLTDEKRTHLENFYGARNVQTQFPLHYATIEQIDAWVREIESVRREFGMNESQMRPLEHIDYLARREQMVTFAETKLNRVYQANDYLPGYAAVLITHRGEEWPYEISVHELRGRFYIATNNRVLGNRENRNALGEMGCYYTSREHALASAERHMQVLEAA